MVIVCTILAQITCFNTKSTLEDLKKLTVLTVIPGDTASLRAPVCLRNAQHLPCFKKIQPRYRYEKVIILLNPNKYWVDLDKHFLSRVVSFNTTVLNLPDVINYTFCCYFFKGKNGTISFHPMRQRLSFYFVSAISIM